MKIEPTHLIGTINPPPSKSISHRALIFAGLGKPGSTVYNILDSEDVQATKDSLERMGANFERIENGYQLVKGIYQGSQILNCQNSGTTIRLLTGVASLFPQKTMLIGDESLNKRPMRPLIDALELLGAEISSSNGTPPIEIHSPVRSYEENTRIQGDVSSQFISSLLIMAAVRGENVNTKINLLPPIVSKPYIDLTVQMLRDLDVDIDANEIGYQVQGKIDLGQVSLKVPADFSSAAFFIVAGAFPGNEITIENLSFDLPQADAKILEFVETAGANVTQNGTSVTIKGEELQPFEFDLSQSPDIFPILCVLATQTGGQSKLYNAKHLRVKETDRIQTMVSNLQTTGIEVEELEDGAIIQGGPIKGDVTLKSFGDHRIAMACAILGTLADKPVVIEDADCVAVSYPTFFDDLEQLKHEIQ